MKEPQLSELGKLIEQRRMELRLTKTALMKEVTISPNTYYRMISEDIGYISLKVMSKMAKCLGMSVSSLLRHDPAYGTKNDYYYNRRSVIQALDAYIDAKLQEQNAPMLVPIYPMVFKALICENDAANDDRFSEGFLSVPNEVAAKPGIKFAIQIFPKLGGQTSMKQSPKYAVLSFRESNNIKIGIEDGLLLAITDDTKFDRIGHCYWDDAKGIVRMERIMHADDACEIKYSSIYAICDVLELIYI